VAEKIFALQDRARNESRDHREASLSRKRDRWS
jgi:hypothetical protein